MSYLDEDFPYRAPITVYNDATAGTYDASITIPPDWDRFWDTVDAAGDDIRVTVSDGRTLATFNATLNVGSKAGTITLDNVTLGATQGCTFWLYWGNPAATTALTGFSPSSPKTGVIGQEVPLPQYTIRANPETPGATKPRAALAVTPDEAINVYIDVEDTLVRRQQPSAGSLRLEEVQTAGFRVDLAGQDQTTMYDESYTRILEVAGRTNVRVRVLNLDDGDDYTGVVLVRTSEGRLIETRFLLMCRATSEV